MPKIDFEPKLDFDQVLIRPKRSELNSRNEVDLTRTFRFKNGAMWTGVPVIAANMSTTGTFEIYQQLSKHKMLTALHKFYNPNDFKEFVDKNGEINAPTRIRPESLNNFATSPILLIFSTLLFSSNPKSLLRP